MSSTMELVVDEVERPARVDLGLDQDRRARCNSPSPGAAFVPRRPFLSIEPVDAG